MTTAKTKKSRMRQAAPKPPRRVRVAKKTPRITDPVGMATFGNKLTAAGTAHPTLFGGSSALPLLTAALLILGSAIVTAQGGSDSAQSALLTASSKVHDIIDQHAAWIQGAADALPSTDAATFITTAGFQVAKAAQRVALTAPELTNGVPTVVHFQLPSIAGAIMWFTEISVDGGKTFTGSVDTEHVKGDITGLTSGQSVIVRLRAYVRGTGYTPWTDLPIIVT